jgi:hypothetical protein
MDRIFSLSEAFQKCARSSRSKEVFHIGERCGTARKNEMPASRIPALSKPFIAVTAVNELQ